MATKSKKTVRRARSRVSRNNSLLAPNAKGLWGNDQPMVLVLAAGIIILIVLALWLTGWL